MLFDLRYIEQHTGSIGRPLLIANSNIASCGSRDKSVFLINQKTLGRPEVALRYWITASDDGALRELDSGMTKAEAQVDDRKAAALVKPRILVATTT